MATINCPAVSHAFFSGTGENTVKFFRPVNILIVTVTGSVNMSLDSGTNFMPLTAGTYQLTVDKQRIDFSGSGSYFGFGISL